MVTPRIVACVAVAVLLATTACTGGDEPSDEAGDDTSSSDDSSDDSSEDTSAAAWVDDVCSSIGEWNAVVADASATFDDPANLSVNAFNATVDSVVSATGDLSDDLSDLGPPDTGAGDEAAGLLTNLSADLESQSTALRDALDPDADTVEEAVANLSAISQSLTTMGTDVTTALADISALDGAAEIQEAVATSDTCQQAGSPG